MRESPTTRDTHAVPTSKLWPSQTPPAGTLLVVRHSNISSQSPTMGAHNVFPFGKDQYNESECYHEAEVSCQLLNNRHTLSSGSKSGECLRKTGQDRFLDIVFPWALHGNTPLVKGHMRPTQKNTGIRSIEPVITKYNTRDLTKCLVAGSKTQRQNIVHHDRRYRYTDRSGGSLLSFHVCETFTK